MNIDKYNSKKSDLRIAPDNCSPLHHNNHYNGSKISNSPSGILPSTQHNNTKHNVSSRFANAISSPSLDETSHTISIATLNVRGFTSNIFKFDAIIDDLFNKDLFIIGIQKTHITE